jgi:hypothetical protein
MEREEVQHQHLILLLYTVEILFVSVLDSDSDPDSGPDPGLGQAQEGHESRRRRWVDGIGGDGADCVCVIRGPGAERDCIPTLPLNLELGQSPAVT